MKIMNRWKGARALVVCAAVGLAVAGADPLQADILWYNGDWDGVTGTPNQQGGVQFNDVRTYENFLVPTDTSWTINDLYANNLLSGADQDVTTAHWEIRSGMSVGDGGTLLFNGDNAVTQTATGGVATGDTVFTEYTFTVAGLNLNLDAGTYWLNLTPSYTSGASYISNTNGDNAINNPPSNTGNSFVDAPDLGYNFFPIGTNFSMGINGTSFAAPAANPVPEPGTWAMMGIGLCGVVLMGRKKKLAAGKVA